MIAGPITVYEAEHPDEAGEFHGVTPEHAEAMVSAGLVYLAQTTHTFKALPGKERALAAYLDET